MRVDTIFHPTSWLNISLSHFPQIYYSFKNQLYTMTIPFLKSVHFSKFVAIFTMCGGYFEMAKGFLKLFVC